MSFIDEIEQSMKENKQKTYSKEEYAQMKQAERKQAYDMVGQMAEVLPGDGAHRRKTAPPTPGAGDEVVVDREGDRLESPVKDDRGGPRG